MTTVVQNSSVGEILKIHHLGVYTSRDRKSFLFFISTVFERNSNKT